MSPVLDSVSQGIYLNDKHNFDTEEIFFTFYSFFKYIFILCYKC